MRYLIISFIVFVSCNSQNDIEYIKENTWNYGSGFKVGEGDFLVFKSDSIFKIRGDTLFYRDHPRAIIVSNDKRLFSLKIRSVNGDSVGVYRNIEESTK